MVYVLLANGFEEIEALTPVDMLRRCGVEVTLVGVGGKEIVGARGVKVVVDTVESIGDDIEMLILPGGYPGYENLEKSAFVQSAIDAAVQKDCYIAAICGAPSVLGHKGLLRGKKACCYPGMEDTLLGANVSFDTVCVDGKFVTSRAAATAMDFAMTLVELLCGKEKADTLATQIVLEK